MIPNIHPAALSLRSRLALASSAATLRQAVASHPQTGRSVADQRAELDRSAPPPPK